MTGEQAWAMDAICDSQDVPANPITWLQEWAIELGGYGLAGVAVVPFWQRLPANPPRYLIIVTKIIDQLRAKVAELSKKPRTGQRSRRSGPIPPEWKYHYAEAAEIVGKTCWICEVDVDDGWELIHIGHKPCYFCLGHFAEIVERQERTGETRQGAAGGVRAVFRWAARQAKQRKEEGVADESKPPEQSGHWLNDMLRDVGNEIYGKGYAAGLVAGKAQSADGTYQQGYDKAKLDLQHEIDTQVADAFARGEAAGEELGFKRGCEQAKRVHEATRKRRTRKPKGKQDGEEQVSEDARAKDDRIAEFLREKQVWLQVGSVGAGVGLDKSTAYSSLQRLAESKRVSVKRSGGEVFYHYYDGVSPT
jgi:hypothetical protein